MKDVKKGILSALFVDAAVGNLDKETANEALYEALNAISEQNAKMAALERNIEVLNDTLQTTIRAMDVLCKK